MTRFIATVLAVTACIAVACVDDEDPWQSPGDWRPAFWTVDGLEAHTRPFGIEVVRPTDGTPADVCAALNDLIRWRDETHDYWQRPAETLAHGWGDCEDLECLAIAVLRRDRGGRIVFAYGYTVPGDPRSRWHAWLDLGDGTALDCRGPRSRPMQVVPAETMPATYQTTILDTEAP